VVEDDVGVTRSAEPRAGLSRTRGVDWRLTTVALVPSLCFCAAFIVRSSWRIDGQRRFSLFDDAMISMSYGRTLARGGGLVWFEGAPRVEGISNPLWTMFMAALHRAGLEGSSAALAVMLAGVVLIAATSLIAASLVARLVPSSRWAPPFAALAVGLTYPFLFWTLRGMEVGLLTFLTMASIVLAAGLADDTATSSSRRVVLLAAVLAMGVATRLDFAIVVTAILIWLAVVGRSRRASVAPALALAGTVGIVIGAMTVARDEYYGTIVPNTYTLKLTGVSLAQRLHRGLVTDVRIAPAALLGVIGLVVLWRAADTETRRTLSLVTAVAIAPVVYSTYVGGDAWEGIGNRYTTVSLLCATVVAVAASGSVASRGSLSRPPSIPLAACVVAAFALTGLFVTGHPSAVSIALVVALGTLGSIGVALLGRSSQVRWGLIVIAAVSAVLASSAASGHAWFGSGGQVVASDARNTDYGLFLATVTNERAVIASVQVGAIAYYSDRPAVDILGKSDAHVASSHPRGSFRPGHNKWDYTYSVGQLRPDVVAQLFKPIPADIALLRAAGYRKLCVRVEHSTRSLWVRRASARIRWKALLAARCRK
jgi:arabinofuranosyltransferase